MMDGLKISGPSTVVPELSTEVIGKTGIPKEAVSTESGSTTSFGDMLKNSLQKVNEYQSQADQAIQELVAGRTKNVHETMLAVERADLSLKLMMQIRNKVIDAYREIMKMQI